MDTDETQVVQPEQADNEVVVEPDWKAEALKYKAIASRYKDKAKQEQPTPPPKEAYSINDEVVDLRLDGYSKTEVEFILRNGGRKELDDKNSFVAIALNTKREQERAEKEASKVTDTSGMTEVERKYTTEQLKNMTAAELEKILPRA